MLVYVVRGNCWANAYQEGTFRHLKGEMAGEILNWMSFAEATASVDRWMDY
ncbi:hypothetical protein [Dysosmobacter sp. Phy]